MQRQPLGFAAQHSVQSNRKSEAFGRSRRSSIKPVAGVGRKSSRLRSTLGGDNDRYSRSNGRGIRASLRSSISSRRTLETTHEIDTLLVKEAEAAAMQSEGDAASVDVLREGGGR